MPQSKKFIITQSEAVANQLLANGFRLLTNFCGTYTFENKTSATFNFEEIDIKKLVFTNKLTF